jgi:hypothetical protein
LFCVTTLGNDVHIKSFWQYTVARQGPNAGTLSGMVVIKTLTRMIKEGRYITIEMTVLSTMIKTCNTLIQQGNMCGRCR